MKKYYTLLAVAWLAVASMQPVTAQMSMFTKVFFDFAGSTQAYSSMSTYDHNYLLAGYRDMAPMALKMDPQGTILWAKRIGITGDFFAVAQTSDSCFVFAGRQYDTVTLSRKLFCVKFTTVGDTVWTRYLDMGADDFATSIIETSDGGLVMSGTSWYGITPRYQGWILKLSAAGVIEWATTITDGTFPTFAWSVKELPDHGFIVAGARGTTSLMEHRMFMMKLTPAGGISWAFVQELTPPGSSEGFDVLVVPDGLVWFVSVYPEGLMVMKTDLSGNFLWASNCGAYSAADEWTRPKLHQTSDGGFIFVDGSVYGPGFMMKTDSLGTAIWSQSLSMNTIDVLEDEDGGYLATGNGPVMGVVMTQTLNPQIGLIKTDSAGFNAFCVYEMGVSSFPDTVELAPYAFATETTWASLASHPPVADANLSANNQCVAISGDVRENSQDEEELRVYPNPSEGTFTVQSGKWTIGRIEVFNSLGKVVFSSSDRFTNLTPIDLRSAPNGIYHIRVVAGKKVCSGKIIINHR